MTDRAEIERLLNQTGRTLEGLPDDYGDEKLKVWRSFRDGTFGHVKSFEMANFILHQSDVIELLVAALRDALDKPMQKPMTLEELKAEPIDSHVWEERKNGLKTYFERTSALVLAHMCTNSKEEMYKYGSSLRAWKRMPTDDEMEAAAWEN